MMDWEYVEKTYGFKIMSIEKIRKVYKLTTTSGVKCFKKAHASKSYFFFVFSAVNHLINKGFNAPIAYDKTVDNDICIEEGEYIYYALPWIDSRQCKFKHQDELIKAINLSAELHKASVGFNPPEGSKPRIYYGRWPENFRKRIEDIKLFKDIIEGKKTRDEFDEAYYPLIDFYINQGYESIELLEKSSYHVLSQKAMEMGEFCHHDMAEHNFLVTSKGDMRIIDFDYCIMDIRLHDLASLIIRNMRHGIWDVAKAYFILEQYSKDYPINNKELEIIKYFMIFPQDFWQIGLQYYVEKQPWAMKKFMSRISNVRRDFQLREDFLKKFIML